MEFPFNVSKMLRPDEEGFVVINAKEFSSKPSVSPTYIGTKASRTNIDPNLVQIIDKMGEASSTAQGLKAVITNYGKFMASDHRLYLKVEGNAVLGLLKTGEKNLFYHNFIGNVKEIRPCCVLDFYVHESVQRGGVGKQLFEKMLSMERIEPSQIAYDRPSPKLIGFLRKHYNLTNYVPQNNNFVIFNQFFDKKATQSSEKEPTYERKDRSVPVMSDTSTNPLLGGSVGTRRMPTTQTSNTPVDSMNAGRQYIPSSYDSRGEQDKSPLFQDKGFTSRDNSGYEATYSKQPPTNNITAQGYSSNFDKYSAKTTRDAVPDLSADDRKMTKEERNLLDVQLKLKKTEEEIAKCKEKIDELNKNKAPQSGTYQVTQGTPTLQAETGGKFANRSQEANRAAPWATHHAVTTSKSSAAYGGHYSGTYNSRKNL